MWWSAEKLRWIVLGGALLLAGVLAALFGLANYRAGKVWQHILARNGVNLQRETDGFTYSQSDGKRTIFTLHAAKAVPHGQNHWSLRNAVLILYNKDGRTDRIYGNQFDYDQDAGTARALGEVHMDLEAPAPAGKGGRERSRPDLSFTPDDESAADPALIHVRTSGLTYARSTGMAATDQPAEFRYKGLTCTSRGAEFDSSGNALRLLADVHLQGTLHDAPFTLTAARAVLDRGANTTDLQRPEIVSGERSAHAAHALLHLHRDGSLEAGDADGGVELHSGTETVSAPQLQATFGTENRPQHARLFEGVTFADVDGRRPAQGSANTVDADMDEHGVLSSAVGVGNVSLLVKQMAAPTAAATRELRAQKAIANFATAGGKSKRSVLRSLHMLGAAEFAGQTPARTPGGPVNLTRVQADDLLTTFAADPASRLEPQRMQGTGNTRLQQSGADGPHQVSTGDVLDARFSERPGAGASGAASSVEISSAVQTGHVLLRSWPAAKKGAEEPQPTVGHAQQAVFTAASGTLVLSGAAEAGMGEGRAEVEDGATDLRARQIVLHQGTGDGEATGGVVATSGGEGSALATHILASRAALLHAANMSQFFGTDAEPAQLWQGGSQVQAARITLDGPHHTLSARPELPRGAVNAVFATNGGAKPVSPAGADPKAGVQARRSRSGPSSVRNDSTRPSGAAVPEASRDAVRVHAATMDYNDLQHEAVFTGGVVMRASEGEVTGDHGAAFLQSAEASGKGGQAGGQAFHPSAGADATGMTNLGGRLERLVMMGEVRLRQPGRSGTGAQITYTAPTSSFVLTGTPTAPPQIRDVQQGIVTGATLLFGAQDSSIVVAGTHAPGKPAGGTRVHTETDLQKQ